MDRPIMPRTPKPLLGLELAGTGVALLLLMLPFGALERPLVLIPGSLLVVLGVWDWAKRRRKH